jgi:hypothetical protein
MLLSEAIRLGSFLVGKPKSGDLRTCGMAMANLATNGYLAEDERDTNAWFAFQRQFPWMDDVNIASATCPKCLHSVRFQEIVWHPFDRHVCKGEMTIEELADFVSTIEPKETSKETREAVEIFCENLVKQ